MLERLFLGWCGDVEGADPVVLRSDVMPVIILVLEAPIKRRSVVGITVSGATTHLARSFLEALGRDQCRWLPRVSLELRRSFFFSDHDARLLDAVLLDVLGFDRGARLPAEDMLDSLVKEADNELDQLVGIVDESCVIGTF